MVDHVYKDKDLTEYVEQRGKARAVGVETNIRVVVE